MRESTDQPTDHTKTRTTQTSRDEYETTMMLFGVPLLRAVCVCVCRRVVVAAFVSFVDCVPLSIVVVTGDWTSQLNGSLTTTETRWTTQLQSMRQEECMRAANRESLYQRQTCLYGWRYECVGVDGPAGVAVCPAIDGAWRWSLEAAG